MNRATNLTRTLISLGLMGLGIGGFLWMGTPEVAKQPPPQDAPAIVKTFSAAEHTDGIRFEVDGVVVPFRQIQVAAQVSGRVEFKADQCRVGRAVKKGQLLLRIEPKDYQLEVKQLTEELAQAEAMIKELDAEILTTDNQIASATQQLEIDVRQLKRTRDLLARAAASEFEVDTAQRSELSSRNTLQTLQDQKNLLSRRRIRLESEKSLQQANLEKAELALERTEIHSPLDGVVIAENVEQNGYVQVGSIMVVLQDTSQLDVTCKLHMHQMHWLWQSQAGDLPTDSAQDLITAYDFPDTPATVIFELGGNAYQWQGVVNRFDGGGIDNQTRMVPCRVHVPDPLAVTLASTAEAGAQLANPPTLMTGMFVKVRIHAQPRIPLVRVPPQAIQPGNTIWTVVDGRLRGKDVSIANANSQFVIAHQQPDGLRAGDEVVVSPLATPIDGLAVKTIGSQPSVRPTGRRGNAP